jgi:hypothetical protein
MKPSQVSTVLLKIASAIDNSKNPKRELVSQDLKKLLVKISSGPYDKALEAIHDGVDKLVAENDNFIKKANDPHYVFMDRDKELFIWHSKQVIDNLAKILANYSEPS